MTCAQPSTRTPRIGLTTYQEQASWRGWDRSASLVPRDFLDPLLAAGALPVLLPPAGGAAAAADLVGWLDGLLLVGGPDVEPARYGRAREADTGDAETARDEWELALLRAAIEVDLPIFGVCRGMQLLNVARGGTLKQEIGEPVHQPAPNSFGRVEVSLAADRLPGSVLGALTTVACYHHQAVDRLGEGVDVTGWSEHGTVESLQLTGSTFALGVQWHPEVDSADARLFKSFVDAAGRFRC